MHKLHKLLVLEFVDHSLQPPLDIQHNQQLIQFQLSKYIDTLRHRYIDIDITPSFHINTPFITNINTSYTIRITNFIQKTTNLSLIKKITQDNQQGRLIFFHACGTNWIERTRSKPLKCQSPPRDKMDFKIGSYNLNSQ